MYSSFYFFSHFVVLKQQTWGYFIGIEHLGSEIFTYFTLESSSSSVLYVENHDYVSIFRLSWIFSISLALNFDLDFLHLNMLWSKLFQRSSDCMFRITVLLEGGSPEGLFFYPLTFLNNFVHLVYLTVDLCYNILCFFCLFHKWFQFSLPIIWLILIMIHYQFCPLSVLA